MFHTGIIAFLSDLRKVSRILATPERPRPHPRLFLHAGEETLVREAVQREIPLSQAYAVLEKKARIFLDEKLSKRTLKGKRLLPTSQDILKRVFYLSLMYRLEPDPAYARQAVREMLAVCRFRDWHPSHYLDTAEITLALAIGYDWLYDVLSSYQRRRIRHALFLKGIVPSLGRSFWVKKHNWNNVCCTGVAVGSISIYESFPKTAAKFLTRAVEANRYCMSVSFEGGCCPEGYSYWAYAANFQVLLFDALERSFAKNIGFDAGSGFLRSARTASMLTTPAGWSFNYADSDAEKRFLYALVWLVGKCKDTSLLYGEKKKIPEVLATPCEDNRLLPLLFVFGHSIKWDSIPVPSFNSLRCEGKVPVFIYRSGWKDPGDIYLGVKGGSASDNHAHLDAGSFVFESESVRWAVDLGKEDYYALEDAGIELFNYAPDSPRWTVFRHGILSHNILTVNGDSPKTRARVSVLHSWAEGGRAGCELDMAPFYEEKLMRCTRMVEVDEEGTLHVCDSFQSRVSGLIFRWAMCTEASVETEGQHIFLSSGGHKRVLAADCRCPLSVFTIPARPGTAFERSNGSCSMVGFFIRDIAVGEDICLRVHLSRTH